MYILCYYSTVPLSLSRQNVLGIITKTHKVIICDYRKKTAHEIRNIATVKCLVPGEGVFCHCFSAFFKSTCSTEACMGYGPPLTLKTPRKEMHLKLSSAEVVCCK